MEVEDLIASALLGAWRPQNRARPIRRSGNCGRNRVKYS